MMTENDMYWKCFDAVCHGDPHYYIMRKCFYELPAPPEKIAELMKKAFCETIDNMMKYDVLPDFQKKSEKFVYHIDKSQNS